jgi:hypothetical protein
MKLSKKVIDNILPSVGAKSRGRVAAIMSSFTLARVAIFGIKQAIRALGLQTDQLRSRAAATIAVATAHRCSRVRRVKHVAPPRFVTRRAFRAKFSTPASHAVTRIASNLFTSAL